MKAIDFIIQSRADLQEKSEHWSDLELFVKLQRSYISLQDDLPYFMTKQDLDIKEGICEYYLDYRPIKEISLVVEDARLRYTSEEFFYIKPSPYTYTFSGDILFINSIPKKDTTAEIVYKYAKELGSINCEIEIPTMYHKALRYLFMSEVHEKPTLNTKQRNLNIHYLKLYDKEIRTIKSRSNLKAKNITSNYQKV